MREKEWGIYSADFETTVFEGQTHTEVWAAAIVEVGTENVHVTNSIESFWDYIISLKRNCQIFFHNLKFDGSFLLDFFLLQKKYDQATAIQYGEYNPLNTRFLDEKDMKNNTVKYSISDKGQWYTITVKVKGKYIVFKDSLKLLPFSVKEIGKAFKTKHQKLEMKYKGFRYAGGVITAEEEEYIKNDVLVVAEALYIMFNEGHDSLTIGSCCLKEYKEICKHSLNPAVREYREMFPDLNNVVFDTPTGEVSADKWIRKSYRGGWCYVVRGCEGRVYNTHGTTADVNSLYPSVMHSESGNKYPVGFPHYWIGSEIPEKVLNQKKFYFVHIKTRFYLKPGKLPFIQIKGNPLYDGTEMLETSDIYDDNIGAYVTHYKKGEKVQDTRLDLYLTMTDYNLLKSHYDLVDFEMIDGCWFDCVCGLFDDYIDKYKQMKQTSKGAKRTLAKLFLNNLYGKLAASSDSSFKVAFEKEDGSLGFYCVENHDKESGYIAAGSAVTSYARNFTITHAQKNFYGIDKPGFRYADTDSLHCTLPPDQLKDIKVHPSDFLCWKLESEWDNAIFTRQKTYIEHVIKEDEEECTPHYDIKCAGMTALCKEKMNLSLQGSIPPIETLSEEDKQFFYNEDKKPIIRTLEDFNIGLEIPGKLRPKRMPGGIVLVDTTYKMH